MPKTYCCKDFEQVIEVPGIELCSDDKEFYLISGCCYVGPALKYCPYCGKSLTGIVEEKQ